MTLPINNQITLVLMYHRLKAHFLWNNKWTQEADKWVTSHADMPLQFDVPAKLSEASSETCVFLYLSPSEADTLSHHTRRSQSPSSLLAGVENPRAIVDCIDPCIDRISLIENYTSFSHLASSYSYSSSGLTALETILHSPTRF